MTSFPIVPNRADHVLVASPNTGVRQRILKSLVPKVRRVEQASGGAEALVHLEQGFCQVLFLDRRLPDLDAEELCQTVRSRFPAVEVVLLGNEDGEVEPEVSSQPTEFPLTHSEEDGERGREGTQLESGNSDQDSEDAHREHEYARPNDLGCAIALPGMIGDSPAMQDVYRKANLVARRDTTVLVTGPTGSGKDLVARAQLDGTHAATAG
jgi:DNA-binding NtrC family response regulator